jgi:hypothetical protein
MICQLNRIVDKRESAFHDYENRLMVTERKHMLELRLESDKQRQLKIELEQRATVIAPLTSQLHCQRQQSKSRISRGQMILPDKPNAWICPDKLKQDVAEDQQHVNRSSSSSKRTTTEQESSRVMFIGRRPPTPPQQLRPLSSKTNESNDEQIFTKRQLQLLNNHSEKKGSSQMSSLRTTMKLSSPILPPIIHRKMPLPSLTAMTKLSQEREV